MKNNGIVHKAKILGLICSLLAICPVLYSQNLSQLHYIEIDSLVMLSYMEGDYETCAEYMQVGKDKAKADFGEQDSVFAAYTRDLGFFHSELGNYDKALPLYIQAINIQEKVLGREQPDFANSLNGLAMLYYSLGDYDKALPLFEQAKNIREKVLGKEDPDFASSLNNLASLHEVMGNYSKALPLYTQCIKIEEKVIGEEHPDFAISLNNLAGLHENMGNYRKALPLYIKAVKISENALGKEHPDFAFSLINLAGLHASMSNHDKALPLYLQAINILKKAHGEEHPIISISLYNLAFLYFDRGNHEKALSLFIQAKDICEETLGKEHPQFAGALNNLAVTYRQMEDYEKAWEHLFAAVKALSQLSLSTNIDAAWANSLVKAKYASNIHLEKMIRTLNEIYILLGLDKAIPSAQEKQIIVSDLAISLLAKFRSSVSNDEDKLRMLSQSSDWVQKSLYVLNPKEHKAKAFNLIDQNKSVLLSQATQSEQAYRLGELPDSLVWKDKKLLNKRDKLHAMLYEKRSEAEKDSLRDILIETNQSIENFVEMLEKEYPKYHKLKYQQTDANVEKIQALLDDQTALIEYVISDSVVHIFYVDNENLNWFKNSVSRKELSKNIKYLHRVLSDYHLLSENSEQSYNDYIRLAHWFYQKLLAPALEQAKGIKNLILVTDGELGHLPFEAFLVEEAPAIETDYRKLHYLLADYNISYNYSAALWKENKEAAQPKNNGQMLAMAANYEIKLDSALKDIRLPTDQQARDLLQALPAARKEVEALQKLFDGFFAFDALASEKTIKAKASEYAIIHLAMHGLLNSKRPVLSSLVFTEDSDSIESNFWQAHEISKLELNANLVVLSACKTGYGKFEKGNGVASLSRSFMYAGSSSLIVSLWQVNDFATSEIMKNLYHNLADGMHKDAALRKAKLQYMKNAQGIAAHPAYWSPFIQIGNTESMQLSRKGTGWVWWEIAGGSVLIVLFGLFAWRSSRKKES